MCRRLDLIWVSPYGLNTVTAPSIDPHASHPTSIPTQFASEEAAWLFEGETDPAKISARLPQRPAVVVTNGGKELAWSIGKVQGQRAAFGVEVGKEFGLNCHHNIRSQSIPHPTPPH